MYHTIDIYRRLLLRSWNNMGPMEYGYVLIAIALAGWFLMRSSLKR